MANVIDMAGCRDQGLRWDAADVEADAAEVFLLNDDHVLAELRQTDGSDVAAGAAADDEGLGANGFHVYAISMNISVGSLRYLAMVLLNAAAMAPSTTR